jgi:hypothetical protein
VARFDGKQGMGKVLYIAQGVHGISGKDSSFSYLQFDA